MIADIHRRRMLRAIEAIEHEAARLPDRPTMIGNPKPDIMSHLASLKSCVSRIGVLYQEPDSGPRLGLDT